MKNASVVDFATTIDVNEDIIPNDGIHFNARGQNKLGVSFLSGLGRLGFFDVNNLNRFAKSLRLSTEKDVASFDIDNSGTADSGDYRFLIEQIVGVSIGDANLDGQFNSSDFTQVFATAQYEDSVRGNSIWETGDWNGDGEFDSADFILAFESDNYESPLAVVPEPNGSQVFTTISAAITAALIHRRRFIRQCRI